MCNAGAFGCGCCACLGTLIFLDDDDEEDEDDAHAVHFAIENGTPWCKIGKFTRCCS